MAGPINTLTPDTSLAIMQAAQDAPRKALAKSSMDEAAESFEAMFVTQMIKPMFETVGVDDVFGGGKGEEVFRDFLTDEYGKLVAKTGGVGLAVPIKQALIQAQAQSTGGTITPATPEEN